MGYKVKPWASLGYEETSSLENTNTRHVGNLSLCTHWFISFSLVSDSCVISHYLGPPDIDMETLAHGHTGVKHRWNLNSGTLALSPCSNPLLPHTSSLGVKRGHGTECYLQKVIFDHISGVMTLCLEVTTGCGSCHFLRTYIA